MDKYPRKIKETYRAEIGPRGSIAKRKERAILFSKKDYFRKKAKDLEDGAGPW